eukprot:g32572.t1
MLLLTDAGVSQNADIGTEMIAGGAVPKLTQLLSATDSFTQEMAAAVLGNLCHESPPNQDKLADAGMFQKLVDLLSTAGGPAQEAAYAIWNLTVGHEENSDAIARLGAVPKLAELLKCTSDIAQENAAGALMHITISPVARSAIGSAIPKLCDLLQASYEPEVSTQAAGALLNLASDSSEYAKMIVANGAVTHLVNLVKEGPDLAREYSAGALMNLTRGDMEVATAASKLGAIPALAALLSKPSGHSESLGALANLASGSSERQIQIYKAQVTRKTVSLLSDQDIDVRRSAAALLMNLGPHPKIKERIVEAGALKPLAKALKDSDEILKERAAGALANLFNDHASNVHAGYQQAPEMIGSLVALIQETGLSEDAKRQGAHALAMLAAEDGPCDAVWQAGAGQPLLALLKDMVGEAALGIMNLSWRWTEVKAELVKCGTLEYLMDMLRLGDDSAKEYAAGALMNLTAGSPDNAEKAAPAVKDLTELLKAKAVQAAEWAAGALANITRSAEATQKTAIEHGAATSIAALLPKVTANGMSLVVLALASLADTQAASYKALRAEEAARNHRRLNRLKEAIQMLEKAKLSHCPILSAAELLHLKQELKRSGNLSRISQSLSPASGLISEIADEHAEERQFAAVCFQMRERCAACEKEKRSTKDEKDGSDGEDLGGRHKSAPSDGRRWTSFFFPRNQNRALADGILSLMAALASLSWPIADPKYVYPFSCLTGRLS